MTEDSTLADQPIVEFVESIVLHKFDGDPTQEEIDNGTASLLETVKIENGEIVEHIIHGQEEN